MKRINYKECYGKGVSTPKYGKGGWLDILKFTLNTELAPLERITGNNFVNFNYDSKAMADATAVTEGVVKGATDVVGSLLLGPVYGVAKGVTSKIGSQIGNSQQNQRGANEWANTTGNIVSELGGYASMFVGAAGGAGNTTGATDSVSIDTTMYAKKGGIVGYKKGGIVRYGEGGPVKKQVPPTKKPNAPLYVNDPNDPRLRAYQDSLDVYKLSKKIPRIYPNLKEISKEDYNSLQKKDSATTHYDLDKVAFNEDKKKGIDKPLSSYVYSRANGNYDDPTYLKNNQKELAKYSNNQDDFNKHSITLPNGDIKVPGTVYDGKPDWSDYSVYSQNGTIRSYNRTLDGKIELGSIFTPKINPIKEHYYGNDTPVSTGSITESSTGWYKGKKPDLKQLREYKNYLYELEVQQEYKKPVQPVVYQAKKEVLKKPTEKPIYKPKPDVKKLPIITPTLTPNIKEQVIRNREVVQPIKQSNIETYTAAGYPMVGGKTVPKGYINEPGNLYNKSNNEILMNPVKFKHGGTVNKIKINIEGGELQVDPNTLNIVADYNKKTFPKHPDNPNFMDPEGNVLAKEGNVIVPKNLSEQYKLSSKGMKKRILNSLAYNAPETKFGGGGWIIPGDKSYTYDKLPDGSWIGYDKQGKKLNMNKAATNKLNTSAVFRPGVSGGSAMMGQNYMDFNDPMQNNYPQQIMGVPPAKSIPNQGGQFIGSQGSTMGPQPYKNPNFPYNSTITGLGSDSKKDTGNNNNQFNTNADKIGAIGSGLVQSLGSAWYLNRYKRPQTTTYERGAATYVNPDQAIRDVHQSYGSINSSLRNLGTAGYLSNRIESGARQSNDVNKIRANYDIANAEIANKFNIFNTEIGNRQVDANQQNEANWAMAKTGYMNNIGQNAAGAYKDFQGYKMEKYKVDALNNRGNRKFTTDGTYIYDENGNNLGKLNN